MACMAWTLVLELGWSQAGVDSRVWLFVSHLGVLLHDLHIWLGF